MYLSILWHLHQPVYRHPDSGEYVLPWVNFHLTKNYFQMAFLAEEAGFPCIFNIVPCLLEQVEDYGRGKAVDCFQRLVEADPRKLKPEELERLRRFLPAGAGARDAAETQLRVLRRFFSPVMDVSRDKDTLLDEQAKIRKKVLPYFKRLWRDGLVELTTSAYYHPLLPLIFDLCVGGETLMPELRFAHPEDGTRQIQTGRDYFQRLFDRRPSGIWPSEGGLSPAVAEAMAAAGYAFAATDENILWKTLKTGPDTHLLYRPYVCRNLRLFFRDRELSDLIGFEYWRWPEKEAVSHLLAKLEEKGRGCPEDAICVIALDGENPWAGYRENGVPFLRELYGRVLRSPGVKPVFLEQYLAGSKPPTELEIVPGTWLGSFSKWVGSPAKNAAWDALTRTRDECGPNEALYIAEGSDWFWWSGEENVTEFEALFNGYLKKARRAKKGGGGV